jgi:sulfur carrier protein ThiS
MYISSNTAEARAAAEAERQQQEDRLFLEFRRKVRGSQVLSASMERLVAALHFTGRVTVVLQNGRVLKSGYEEGYFRRKDDVRLVE